MPTPPRRVSHTTHFDGLELGSLPERAQIQVRGLLARIAADFQDESDQLDPVTRKAQITVKIELTHTLEDRTTQLVVKVEGKLPGYRGTGDIVKLPHAGERFLIEIDDATQLDMYTTPDTDSEDNVQ